MATVSISTLPPDPSSQYSSKVFHPRLTFAETIWNIPRSFTYPKPNSNHRSPFLSHRLTSTQSQSSKRFYPISFSPPKPRSWSLKSQVGNLCYRCGNRGHHARNCRSTVRCYSCGNLGHKRSRCFKKEVPKPDKTKDPRSGWDDPSWILQKAQPSDYGTRVDCMMLDPDVAGFSQCKGHELLPFSIVAESGDISLGASEVRLKPAIGNSLRQSSSGPIGEKCLEHGNFGNLLKTVKWNRVWASVLKSRRLTCRVGLGSILHRQSNGIVCGTSGLSTRIKLPKVTIIDRLNNVSPAECYGEAQADITFYSKPFGNRYCTRVHRTSTLPAPTVQLSINVFLEKKRCSAAGLTRISARRGWCSLTKSEGALG